MNLAFQIYSYFPYGGQQRDFRRIVQECIARGHQVRIYTRKWQGDRLPGAELRFVPARALSRLGMYRRFTDWMLADLAEHPVDALVGFNKMPGLDIYFAADPCFAEKAEYQRGAYYRYTPRFRHFRRYEQSVFGPDSLTDVLALSALQIQAYEKYYPGCAGRLTLMPPGVDRDRLFSEESPRVRQQLRDELGLTENELLVLQVGSGFRVKGVDRSLKAVAALPAAQLQRVRYLLIGQDRAAGFRRLARRLGITDRVTIMPGRDDIPRFLAGADLLLHPAYSESAGYVLLEATISGLPVLTTATCGYACHIEQAQSGLVCAEPFSQQELNNKLAQMLDSTQTQTWRANGIAYGRQQDLYSLAQAAGNHIENFVRKR